MNDGSSDVATTADILPEPVEMVGEVGTAAMIEEPELWKPFTARGNPRLGYAFVHTGSRDIYSRSNLGPEYANISSCSPISMNNYPETVIKTNTVQTRFNIFPLPKLRKEFAPPTARTFQASPRHSIHEAIRAQSPQTQLPLRRTDTGSAAQRKCI